VSATLSVFSRRATSSTHSLTQAIPVVLAGGTVTPDGFFERYRAKLQSGDLPVKRSEVRVSTEPLNSTARGLLMTALC
jgi:hypothetical protein